MRELSPQLSAHREEKLHIEEFLKIIEDELFLKEAAIAFFGAYKQEKYGGVSELETPLTESEYSDFKIFFLHVAKRIISATSQKLDGYITYGINGETKITNLSEMNAGDRGRFLSLLFHDISHSAGQIAKNGAKTNLSAVQPFLQYKKGKDYNVKELLEDELRGFIFGSLYYPAPFGVRPKLHLETNRTYEDFKNNFLRKTLTGALADNSHLIEDNSEDDYEIRNNLKEEAGRLAEEIINNPPEDVIKALRYIWDHREDPKVLVNLFFEKVGPYIEQLKKRKVYDLKK